MAQKCFRAKGDDKCPYHPTENVILRCTQCADILVCVSCVASTHNGHLFAKLNEGIEEKIEMIKQFVIATETLTIPQLTQEIISITQKMKETAQQYQAEIESVINQAEQLKNLVDLLLAKEMSRLESLMKNDQKSSGRHKKYLEQFKKKLEDNIIEHKSTIQSGNDILVLDTEADIVQGSDDVIPPSPDISIPRFVSCDNPEPHIVKAFGDLIVT